MPMQSIKRLSRGQQVITLNLSLDVTYAATTTSTQSLCDNLHAAVARSIGKGLLTANESLEVNSHALQVQWVEPRSSMYVNTVAQRNVFARVEAFLDGFADDDSQTGVAELINDVRRLRQQVTALWSQHQRVHQVLSAF
jgi:hypothetical protein